MTSGDLRMLAALVFPKTTIPFADAETRPPHEVARYSPLKKLSRRLYLKGRAHVTDAGIQIIGWPEGFNWKQLLGALVSGALLSLGAPFWFNSLKALTNLRPIVASKQKEEEAKSA